MTDDMVGALFSALTTPVVLLVLFAVTRMGAEGDMGRNSAVGIRLRATQRSDAAWRAGHAAALPVVKVSCVVVLALDLVCLALLFLGPGWLTPWLGGIPIVALLLALVPVVRAAARGAKNAPGDELGDRAAASSGEPE